MYVVAPRKDNIVGKTGRVCCRFDRCVWICESVFLLWLKGFDDNLFEFKKKNTTAIGVFNIYGYWRYAFPEVIGSIARKYGEAGALDEWEVIFGGTYGGAASPDVEKAGVSFFV